jgi:protein-L-isoaspartate O-methyltransferase
MILFQLSRLLIGVVLGGLVLGSFSLQGQGVHPKSGRRIAGVMGVGGADWLERAEREREEAPTKAIEMLDLKPGMVVADVGAGVGYYATRMAKKVGAAGKIYANEIQSEMLTLLRRRLAEEKVGNIEVVLGTETDPKLPKGALDLIIMVDVYHEFAQPQRMLRRLRDCLKPDGRLVLLEFRKEDPYVPIRADHKMSVTEAKLELEDEGFVLEKVLHDLPWQHMMFFKKAGA